MESIKLNHILGSEISIGRKWPLRSIPVPTFLFSVNVITIRSVFRSTNNNIYSECIKMLCYFEMSIFSSNSSRTISMSKLNFYEQANPQVRNSQSSIHFHIFFIFIQIYNSLQSLIQSSYA